MLLLWFCNSQDGKTYIYGGCVTIMAHGKKYLFYQYLQGLWQTTDTMKTTSLVAQLVKDCLQCRRLWFDFWVGRIPWRVDRLRTPVFLGFPGGSDGKESAYNVGDLGSIPGLGRSPGGGHGKPFQYSCLENPHGQRSLTCYSSWGRKKSDMTERLNWTDGWGTKRNRKTTSFQRSEKSNM